MKQPSLKAEDGAEFFGLVEPIEGQFRASCYARSNDRAEEPEIRMHASEDGALRWIGRRAAERDFLKWWQERSAPPS